MLSLCVTLNPRELIIFYSTKLLLEPQKSLLFIERLYRSDAGKTSEGS